MMKGNHIGINLSQKKFFGVSSYVYHKNHNFILKNIVFHCILLVVTLSILNSNEFNHLIFFFVFQFSFQFWKLHKFTRNFFLFETKKKFFWTLKVYNLYNGIPSNSKMFVHIVKSFIWLLEVAEKQKCSRGKKGPFFP